MMVSCLVTRRHLGEAERHIKIVSSEAGVVREIGPVDSGVFKRLMRRPLAMFGYNKVPGYQEAYTGGGEVGRFDVHQFAMDMNVRANGGAEQLLHERLRMVAGIKNGSQG